ncbi:hydroxyacylglutathione hydrolase [Marinobacter sp.]|uniref:hydroxyacylglutathione hydrolase n=1 Tax=Marinobacter sp. TaxID=50741 RepID=UPI0034A0E10C
MLTVTPIPAFNDNYIWCIADTGTGKALIVDPGQAEPVKQHLSRHNLSLDIILVTHHHPDHVGGVNTLAQESDGCRIVGPSGSPFSGITNPVHPGDDLVWNSLTFQVLGVPGHTLDHIAFYTDSPVAGHPALFCGDTLFVCGCGRLFEGSPAQMRQSLESIRQLPDDTRVYCAHEYTLANLRFARSWLPGDDGLRKMEAHCQSLRDADKPTVPSVLGDEKRLNPFLRWDDPQVIDAAKAYGTDNGLPSESPDQVFAAIRHGKDHF